MRHKIHIGTPYGTMEQFVPHWPAVHKKELMAGGALVDGRQARIAGQAMLFTLRRDGQGIILKIPAHHSAEPNEPGLEQIAFGFIQPDRRPVAIAKRESDMGMRHGQALDNGDGMAIFSTRRFQELEACRRGIEQVPDLNSCSLTERGWLCRRYPATFDRQTPGVLRPAAVRVVIVIR